MEERIAGQAPLDGQSTPSRYGSGMSQYVGKRVHHSCSWFGRFVHPELGRLLEELASAPLPGVVIVTTRFPLPTLEHRAHARLLSLSSLDPVRVAQHVQTAP